MKVIKITKTTTRPRHKYHYLVFDDSISDDDITCEVENWCEADPGGSSYGYSWKWDTVTDLEEKRTVIEAKVKSISDRMKCLDTEREKLESFYKTLA